MNFYTIIFINGILSRQNLRNSLLETYVSDKKILEDAFYDINNFSRDSLVHY